MDIIFFCIMLVTCKQVFCIIALIIYLLNNNRKITKLHASIHRNVCRARSFCFRQTIWTDGHLPFILQICKFYQYGTAYSIGQWSLLTTPQQLPASISQFFISSGHQKKKQLQLSGNFVQMKTRKSSNFNIFRMDIDRIGNGLWAEGDREISRGDMIQESSR